MKVLHLSTKDIGGGAARAAHRLHRGIGRMRVETCMFVRHKQSDQESIFQFEPEDALLARVRRLARYIRIRSDFFPFYVAQPGSTGDLMSDDRTRFAKEVSDQLPSSDILHFHYVARFVDVGRFFERTDLPIVWTLHDMAPFTGGCRYNLGCRHFERKCGWCPRLDSSTRNDPSHRGWKRKRAAFEGRIEDGKLHVVSPSKWLARGAQKSTLLSEAPIHCIPHGLDHEVFRPQETDRKRRELGIPDTRKILLFVAQSSENPLKGFGHLTEALRKIDIEDVTLVSVGRNEPEVPANSSHVHVGYIDDDSMLSTIYSMADVFVIPSLQEAFGQTALESMACGTPVVGFNAGGIPDMVRPNETGWLAETGNVRSLRKAIERALMQDGKRHRMSKRCREVVEEEYTLKKQANQYLLLYRSILEQNTDRCE